MSTSITQSDLSDLSDLTAGQRQAWAAGNYSMVVSRTKMVSKRPHDEGDLRARWRGRARDSRGGVRC
jgi:hypothetical protein